MAELGPLSRTHPEKLKLAELGPLSTNPSPSTTAADSWMWNSNNLKQVGWEDDSWEVRAFEEDTNHAMGTTWPPRSYTCTFCRREFRSAQALGGHMNVHRHDRARLYRQTPSSSSAAVRSTHLMPTQEFVAAANGGICFLYSLQNPNGGGGLCMESSLSPLSNSAYGPYLPNNLVSSLTPSFDCLAAPLIMDFTLSHSGNNEPSASIDISRSVVQELDLELRLGRSSSSS